MTNRIALTGIACKASVGVLEWEKKFRQEVLVDLALEVLIPKAKETDNLEDTVDYHALANRVIAVCQRGHYGLLERLAEELASAAIDFDGRIVGLELSVHKPGALEQVRNVSVRLRKNNNLVIVGIGSNKEADKHVGQAIKYLKDEFSPLAEAEWITTKAVARPAEPDYINTAVLVRTALSKTVLMRRLAHIEYAIDQQRVNDGTKAIDLDLLIFNDQIVDADLFARTYLQQLVRQLSPDLDGYLRALYVDQC